MPLMQGDATRAGKKRRLQFSLGTLCLFVVVCGIAGRVWLGYHEQSELEGSWREIGRHRGLTITFHRDQLAIANQAGKRTSQFTLGKKQGTITILRSDGIQQGVYRLNGDQLEMNLANVGFPPPKDLFETKRDTKRYLFQREP